MRKYWLLLMLLCLVLIPTSAHASASFISYGPVGTITTPYPTITALVHTYNSYLLLNETTLYLGTSKLNFTATLSNSFPNGADITVSYQSQKWLLEGSYTVRLDANYTTGSSITRSTLTKQWVFTVVYDSFTKDMFAINSTLVSINSTVSGLRHDYDTTIGNWLPTLQTMNNTMHYWNGTIQNTYNLIATIQGMFQSPNGSIYILLSDAKDYIAYGLFGLGILLLSGLIALALIVRRTRRSYESQPPMVRAVGPPSYPAPPRLQPQVSVRQPTGTMSLSAGGQIVCPSCGQQNRQQAIYCANCKNKLVPEEAHPS